MNAGDERFFFVHLQKTAGTSLLRRMKRHFGLTAIYPNDSDGDPIARVISVDHLIDRWNARKEELRLIAGHFPLCTTERLGGGFTTITILREPVERTLSYLRHHRTLDEDDRTLEDIYQDPLRFHGLAHNHMVKMFSLTSDEMTDGALTRVDFTPDRLERAKERLAGVDVVGLQDHFEEFCDKLTRRFGWDLGEPAHVNRTEPMAVSDDFRKRIAHDNAMDVELYEFARDLVGAAPAPATGSS